MLRELFPWASSPTLLSWEHSLMWQMYGGVGYGYTRADVLDMSPIEIMDRIDRGNQARRDTQRALQKKK